MAGATGGMPANGAYLIYAVDLPNDDGSKTLACRSLRTGCSQAVADFTAAR
jgi:hypothetical protein